ncbi:unnamed protein product [Caenorhabditis angaria]|uniref:U3 small nucleolar RNA-associated protein 13 C-terminal domain-containing protein n=1 Tax=Caenorhabditis angaria TaxID=860376 RepID=A0A9P1I8Z7_9PELO|nr:unnamed protein product [Caenorhabditis angaria]
MSQLIKEISQKRSVGSVFTGGFVKWSANGQRLFSTCSNIVKVIDLENNDASYTIGDPEDELRITCIALDKNRNRLLIAYNNHVIREYTIPLEDGEEPQLAKTWKTMHTAPILVMEFSENGVILATGSADHITKVWNLEKQQCTHTLKGPSVVSSIVFGKHDKLVVGYIEGQLHLYDITLGAEKKFINEWKTHSSNITALLRIEDTRLVVALSRDQTMSIHETETQETIKVLPLFESIESAAIGHNGNLFTVGEEGILKEFKIETAKLLKQQKISGTRLDQISYDPITNRFLSVSAETNIYIIDFEDLKISRQLVGSHDEIYSCCIFGKNESHIAVASNTNEIRIYDSQTLDCQLVFGHTESVLGVVSPSWDTSLLASCSKDNSIIFWRLSEENEDSKTTTKPYLFPISVATGHANSVTSLSFSNTTRAPYITSVSSDSMIKLWSLRDLIKLQREVKIEEDSQQNIFDLLPKVPCSSTLVAHAKDVNCVDVADSDNVVATGGMDKLVKLWQVDTTKMQLGIGGTLSGHRRGVGDVRFAKNAHKLASCSGDMTIKIWNISDKTCQQTLTGHTCAVFRILFISSDNQLISADSSGIIKIWTVKNSECETTVDGHTDKIWSLTAKAEESEFVTAGSDGKIVVWKNVTEEKEMAELEKRREKLEQEQTLTNLLEQQRFDEALEFALGLVRPFCAYKVITTLIDHGQLASALPKLDSRKIQILLDFTTQWNTNSRTSQVAQRVLFELFMIIPPEEFLEMPNSRNLIESFLPYTNRHLDRLDRARQDASLLEFIWKQMRIA